MDSLPLLLVIVFCIIASAYFSASETAFSTMNRIRMKNLADGGDARAATALKLVDNYDKLISTILIGNNIVNIISASLATVVFTAWLADAGVSISTAVMTVVVLIFGEISPKTLAKENAEFIALATARLMWFLYIVLTPLNSLFSMWKKLLNRVFKKKSEPGITAEELITMVDEAQNDGGIDEHNGELIRSAIEFDDLDAGDILTPRVDLVAVDKNTPMDEVCQVFVNNTYSRLPVYEDSIDNIVGMIHEKDFFTALNRKADNFASAIKPVIYVSSGIKISRLLRLIQQAKTHVAVVVDEFGGTEGIVTLEDILEQLVGDIWDEHDIVEQEIEELNNTTFMVSGSCSLEDFFEMFRLPEDELEEYESVTVGGWVMEELGCVPEIGAHFAFHQNEVYVTKVEKRHVKEIRFQLSEPLKTEEKE